MNILLDYYSILGTILLFGKINNCRKKPGKINFSYGKVSHTLKFREIFDEFKFISEFKNIF